MRRALSNSPLKRPPPTPTPAAQANRRPVTVTIPCEALRTAIDDFSRLIQRNRESLQSHSVEEASKFGRKEKAEWWKVSV